MLLFFGVTPYLIFDGDDLPSKSGTESDRLQRRQDSKALGLELQRKGRVQEAYQEFQKAVDVTPYMARQLIEELKKMNVQYVVAPYEADSQLVYLERQGIINGIISEDSDLLVFGAKRLLSKLDQHGDCIEINRADFTACKEVSLIGWTDADFRRMCILSGCDYLPNIPKLGLKTAYRCIRKYKNVERALRMLQFEGQYRVPADYLQNFKQAELTFLYQRVFCPKAGKLVTLTPPASDVNVDELPYIGADVEPELAIGVARGDLDPTTKEPIILKPSFAGRVAPCGLQRRQTLGSSAELKSNKPINTFFTPKRTPLAELDPNSLTPSPSQQRLLERYSNTSWDSSPVPSQPGGIRSAPSITRSARVSSPLARSAGRNSFLAQAAQASTFQPAKRQRLCSETGEEEQSTPENNRSRFFAGKEEDHSPIRSKTMKARRPRRSNLSIFSDDLAEDIMSQLPDPSQSQTDTPEDSQESVGDPSGSPSSSAAAGTTAKDYTDSNKPASEKVATPEFTDTKPASINPEGDVPRPHNCEAKKESGSLLSKFAFQPTESPGLSRKPSIRELTTPGSSPAGLLLGARKSPSRRQRLTPLQRLGQSALSRSRSMNLPTMKPLFPPASVSNESTTTTATTTVDNTADLCLEQEPKKPTVPQGSEDMIVPDSEDESENDDTNHSKPQRGSIPLNLKQFSFTTTTGAATTTTTL